MLFPSLASLLFLHMGAAAQTCTVPPPGLIGWWAGDGNTTDLTGGGDGTFVGTASFMSGKVGQAFSFDGNTGNYVQVPSRPTLQLAGALTIDAWVNLRNLGNSSRFSIIVAKGNRTPTYNYQLTITDTGAVRFENNSGSRVDSAPIIIPGAWYHVAATHDGIGTVGIYVNGTLIRTGAYPTGSIDNDPLRIGRDCDGCPSATDGLIDEVEIFNRALTATEIQAIYDAGTAGKCKPAAAFQVCLLYDPSKVSKAGSTVPIKVQLCDSTGTNQSTSAITLSAINVTKTSSSVSGDVQDAGNANPDQNFRFDASLGGTGGYIYNLKTQGLTTGSYNLTFSASGGTAVYSAPFQIR
jgi:hypothetical protein